MDLTLKIRFTLQAALDSEEILIRPSHDHFAQAHNPI